MAAKKKRAVSRSKAARKKRSLAAKKAWETRRKRYGIEKVYPKPKLNKKQLRKIRSEASKKGWAKRRSRSKETHERLAPGIERQRKLTPEFSKFIDDYLERYKREKNPKKKKAMRDAFPQYIGQLSKIKIETDARREAREQTILELQQRGVEIPLDMIKDFVDTDESIIMARMRLADTEGRAYEEAFLLAEEFEMTVQGVYSLFLGSP